MARIDSLANFLEDVATKIRSKTGSQSTITPANYDTEIEKIVFKPTNIIFGSLTNSTSLSQNTTTTSIDLKNLDTSLLTTTKYMFCRLTALTSLDLSNFNTSNVTNMQSMFGNCHALASLDLSNFNTSNVATMNNMFNECYLLTSLDLSNFNTSNVTNMGNMFCNCTHLETITFGNNFNLTSITTLSTMFKYCTKLDNNTLNQILHICTTVGNNYTGNKTLGTLGINSTFDNFANIPNLSNYQAFLDAGWTIS